MIKKEQLIIIKKEKRLVLSPKQKIKHYFIVIIPLIFIGLIVHNNLKDLFTFGFINSVCIIISFVFYLVQRKRIRFKEFSANFSYADIIEALRRTANELEWKIVVKNEYYFQANRNFNGKDLITIVIADNLLLINSVADPNKFSFPLISLTDKENRLIFIKHLNDVLNHQIENKDYLIPKKEWTTKRIITRLILYPFWLFVITISLYMIFNPIWYKSIWAGIWGLIFGVGYIIIDIKLIIKRKKYERKPTLL